MRSRDCVVAEGPGGGKCIKAFCDDLGDAIEVDFDEAIECARRGRFMSIFIP